MKRQRIHDETNTEQEEMSVSMREVLSQNND